MSNLINPFTVAPAGPTDPNFASVVALLHCEGSNGSTTLTNSAIHGSTFAVSSPAHGAAIDTSQFLFGASCVNLPQTGGDSTYTSSSADYSAGTGDFTLEFAYYVTSNTDTYLLEMTNACRFDLSNGGTGHCYFEIGGSALILNSASATNTLNAWNRVSLSRIGTTMYGHFNGTFINSATGGVATTNFSGTDITLGKSALGGFPTVCRIDEFRLTIGVGRYNGSNYSVATAAFPDQ